MAAAVREMKWIVPLVKDLGISPSTPVAFYCDSQAAIHIASNPVFHERTKHIERDCHSVRDAAKVGLITMRHVRTKDQLADILTKVLGRLQSSCCRSWEFRIFHLQLEGELGSLCAKDHIGYSIVTIRKTSFMIGIFLYLVLGISLLRDVYIRCKG